MKAVVIGATGATGRQVVKHLLEADWISEVSVLVRKKSFEEQDKLQEHVVDFDQLSEYRQWIVGDVAFSCLGTTLKDAGSKEEQWKVDYTYQYNFAQLAYQNGVSTFVLQSAINADASSKLFFSRMKGELEENIKLIGFERLVLCKPSFLIRPNTKRTLENIGVQLVYGLNKLGLLKSYSSLPVDLVAQAMVASVQTSTQRIYELGVHELLAFRAAQAHKLD